MSLKDKFLQLDDFLAEKGVPKLTSYWRDGIGEFLDSYEAGKALELVACVGRGSAKSTALYKLGLFFALFTDAVVPPAERHYAIILSRLTVEAGKGIQIISRWLTLLSIKHRLAGDVIDLDGVPRGIRVVAASVAATSGWRAFFVGRDERSKWGASGLDEMDADEVDTSSMAMTATHARAPVVSVGSAWGAFGGFYDAVMHGTTEERIVLGPSATWIAAPHITEASCRKKEKDVRRFEREYACRFQSGSVGALDVEQMRACVRELKQGTTLRSGYELVIDASGGKNDAFVASIWAWVVEPNEETEFLMMDAKDAAGNVVHANAVFARTEDGHLIRNPKFGTASPVLFLAAMKSWEGPIALTMSTSDVAKEIAQFNKPFGATRAHLDQYNEWGWRTELARFGITAETHHWGPTNKPDAVSRLKEIVRTQQLVINPLLGDEGVKLLNEAGHFQETITPSGAYSFGARGRFHDDRIACCITACMADSMGRLTGSPMHKRSRKHVIHDNQADMDADYAAGYGINNGE